jgi:DNA polymerase-1
MYPEYKANRVQVNAVSVQELVVRRLIELLGICSVAASGYEADDLIASVTVKFKDKYDIVIVTGDKDMLQLVDDKVTVYDSMKDIFYTEKTALEKFGVKPDQISDYLALVGDKVDNIPGVRGIGPKAAQDLLSLCKSTDEIIHRLPSMPTKYQEKLIKDLEALKISRKLTELIQLDLPIVETDIVFSPSYTQAMDEILDRLEFSEATKNRVKKMVSFYE